MAFDSRSDIVYDQLDAKSSEFRLLRLLKKDYDDDLPSCELFHSSLEKKISYEALSYTWGDADVQGKIRLNGRIQLVTRNLARALADIRSRDASRILWVDALCIDQGNVWERNHQVKQMGRIYENAKRVLVWLGRPENSRRHDGLSTLKFLNGILVADLENLDASPMHRLRMSISIPEHWEKWHDLAVLCELPYWSRLWIIQEIGLASDLEVYHGYSSIDWGSFTSIRELLAEIVDRHLCPQASLPLAKMILESMPARLVEQRTHQRPVWLNKLQNDLHAVIKADNRAIKFAYVLCRLWSGNIDLSGQELDEDYFAINTIMLGNHSVNWLFGSASKIADDIAALPSRLEHVRDQQREESDEMLLRVVDTLKGLFNYGSMQRLSFIHRIHRGLEEQQHALQAGSEEFKRLGRLLEIREEVVRFEKLFSILIRDLQSVPELLRKYRKQQQPAFHLQTLLENCERSLCQEPRDKVYGLLGLASNINDGEIAVDYSKPMFDLYENVIMHHSGSQKGAESEGGNSVELVRFSQLLQRSLSGPFPTNGLPGRSVFKIQGYISGSILPLETVKSFETSANTIDREWMTILKSYLQGSVDSFALPSEISKSLNQLRAAQRDRILPHSGRSNSGSQGTATAALTYGNHLRLFGEASGLIGLSASNIREDDLLCLFAECDVACIVRPVDENYKIISRAVVAKRFEEKEQRVSSASPELFQYHVPEPSDLEEKSKVWFEVDALRLQELTCPTSPARREYIFSTPGISTVGHRQLSAFSESIPEGTELYAASISIFVRINPILI
jgi:hypothetical protein